MCVTPAAHKISKPTISEPGTQPKKKPSLKKGKLNRSACDFGRGAPIFPPNRVPDRDLSHRALSHGTLFTHCALESARLPPP